MDSQSKNTEKYKRSLYLSTAVLSNRQECTVEKVVNSLDGAVYVRRSYKEDKTEIYRLLAELNSQFVPEIIEIFENDGGTEIIERYVEGETLAEIISEGKVTKKLAKSIARQLLRALEDIQERDIIHRDIKPENIMLSDGKLLLIDFGIARVYKEGETRDTRHLGTEGYAAPEQYGFSQSDKRTDIFSAGKTILRVCEAAKLKGAVRRTAERCAQFDPMQRFATAAAALAYLSRLQKIPIFAGIMAAIIFTAAGLALNGIRREKVLQTAQEEAAAVQQTEQPKTADKKQQVLPKPEDTQKPKAQETAPKQPKTKTEPKAEQPASQQPEKALKETAKTNAEEKQAAEAEQPQAAQSHSRQDSVQKPANYREHSEVIHGDGKVLELFYPGEEAHIEDSVKICGESMKISAQLKRKKLQMQVGDSRVDIIFGDFVSHYQSDTTVLDADIFLQDIDGDGVEELFAGVRLRHGFATSSSTLWFARYTNGKFVLCDKPIYFNDYIAFNIYGNNRIITSFWGDCFHIEGNKFIEEPRFKK